MPRSGTPPWKVRQGLAARAQSASRAVADQDARIQRARRLLMAGRSRVDDWTLDDDFGPVCAGVAKTYKQGRKRFTDSLEQPSDQNLHEWRKGVKYSWYHIRLLRGSAPSVLKPLADRLHDLSDVLGDDHNLAVLTGQLRSCPDEFGGTGKVNEALVIVDGRRADLQRRALPLGARLYAERPSTFADRMTGYWRAWREFGEELPAGEIADLAPPGDDLDGLTREELDQKARQLELAGWSSMNRHELVPPFAPPEAPADNRPCCRWNPAGQRADSWIRQGMSRYRHRVGGCETPTALNKAWMPTSSRPVPLQALSIMGSA